MGMSGAIFMKYYVNPTFEIWQNKSNPKYPSPDSVRNEIIQMIKGMATATLLPSLSLYLAQHGLSKAYCGFNQYGIAYDVFQFFLIWIGTDLWEFYYHRMGHTISFFWDRHKPHHTFYNPSPFAVIADEYTDQFVRSAPLLLFPLLLPINMDIMYFEFAVFFYGYGTYLHWGYEFEWLDAHHPIMNTAFQHYIHHAQSIINKPYHTGFFFKIWDQLAGSVFDQECVCAKCCRAKGLRTREAFAKIEKPDYSVLLSPSFWLTERATKSA
eukprot:TRINITY_DN14135_c0_g1_i1.p1 TRINITY_DN14135_c0_g1~~TRINITY_DN14135_c0_g1_i1.p1  ORF type:complete len:307 (-),score=103.77 TRINITY_DN14135_c0_g1_i1:318-1121(-)